MQPYTYLIINFLSIIICFVYSFSSKIQFNKQFPAFFKAAIVVAIPFIAWDAWFTAKGVWWFNTSYTMGQIFWGLPLEEWLFFFCIPFACVFTYYCLSRSFNLSWANAFNNLIVFAGCIICIVVALSHPGKLYTLVTALAATNTLLYMHFIARREWIGEVSLVYTILMLGFFPVNGVLTGFGLEAPIVNYNPAEILNIRLLTIPIEDTVYGYTQFLWLIYFFNLFRKDVKKNNIGTLSPSQDV